MASVEISLCVNWWHVLLSWYINHLEAAGCGSKSPCYFRLTVLDQTCSVCSFISVHKLLLLVTLNLTFPFLSWCKLLDLPDPPFSHFCPFSFNSHKPSSDLYLIVFLCSTCDPLPIYLLCFHIFKKKSFECRRCICNYLYIWWEVIDPLWVNLYH